LQGYLDYELSQPRPHQATEKPQEFTKLGS